MQFPALIVFLVVAKCLVANSLSLDRTEAVHQNSLQSHGIFQNVKSKTNPQTVLFKEMLSDFASLVQRPEMKAHIKGWHIAFGTLIGCQRGGKFVPWDQDLDVAVYGEPFKDKAFFDTFKQAVDELSKKTNSLGPPHQKNYVFDYMGWDSTKNLYRIFIARRKPDGTLTEQLQNGAMGPDGEGLWLDIDQYHSCTNGNCVFKEALGDGTMAINNIFPEVECKLENLTVHCPKDTKYFFNKLPIGDNYMKPDMVWSDKQGMWVKDDHGPVVPANLASPPKIRAANTQTINPDKAEKTGSAIERAATILSA